MLQRFLWENMPGFLGEGDLETIKLGIFVDGALRNPEAVGTSSETAPHEPARGTWFHPWPKGKPRGRKSLEERRRCRRPRQVLALTEERARQIVKTFGCEKFKGKPYFELPLNHLRWLLRNIRRFKDPRQRAACQMALERAERQPPPAKPPRLPGRPKRIFRTEGIDRLRAQGWSERRISAELGIPRRTVARKHPKPGSVTEEFCATPKPSSERDLHENALHPPHTPLKLKWELWVSV